MTEPLSPASPTLPRGPLHGVKVLDLSRVLAGPYCTMLLWELGAEVLKVETPGHGDDTRAFPPFQGGESIYFASVNRGKRSLALDLKADADRVVFEALVASHDVLVENFRPGTMEKLGYGPEAVAALNPQIQFARISGFGQTGPYRERPAYDLIVQALGGLISINGPEGSAGLRVGISIGDLAAGVFAALGIVATLFARGRTGTGHTLDIAMLDVQTMLLESALVRALAGGGTQGPTGSRHPVITPFDVFATADGPIAIAAANDHLFADLMAALGRPEVATDPAFASGFGRYANQVTLKALIEDILRQQPLAHWLALLEAAGVPVAPIRTMGQVIADPHLAARGMFVEITDPEMGTLKVAGSPFKISGYAQSATRPPAPNLDEARPDVLKELGSDTDPPRPRVRGGEKLTPW